MPSVLLASSYMAGAGPLPRQRPADTLACCHTTRRATVSISMSRVLGDRDGVGAAVVAHRHLGALGGVDVDGVETGAESCTSRRFGAAL